MKGEDYEKDYLSEEKPESQSVGFEAGFLFYLLTAVIALFVVFVLLSIILSELFYPIGWQGTPPVEYPTTPSPFTYPFDNLP